jgi:FKBP-type peptidyl-prolyl cis-trans isomerase
MKHLTLIFAVFSLTLPLLAQEKSPPLKDQKDKVSYSIGLNIGANLGRQNVEVNPEALTAGLKDGIAGKPQLTQDQIKEVMTAFEKDMQEKQKAAGEKSAGEGKKFLEENKKKEGVKTTASGLQYKVMKEGTGAQPKGTDTVTVNYRGTLISGNEFDSSYKRGQPATFPLNGVIKGWTEGLQLMKTGSKYQLFVPPDLAYGERTVGADIPPNATLIFEVELLDIKPAAEAGTSPATSPSIKLSPAPKTAAEAGTSPAASPSPKRSPSPSRK